MEVLKALLEDSYGLNIDQVDGSGSTPLHLAVFSGSIDCVQEITKYNPDINKKNHNLTTALHVALQLNFRTIAYFLTEAGGDIHVTDGTGRSALNYCMTEESKLALQGNIHVLEFTNDDRIF